MSAGDSTDTPLRVLVVDDDDVFRERLERALRSRGFRTASASNSVRALELVNESPFSAAIIDLRMPGGSGLELLRRLREFAPEVKALLLTGYGSIATALEAVRLGAVHYLTKPVDVDEVLAALGLIEPTVASVSEAPDKLPVEVPVEVPSLSRVEWEHINRVLQDCDGNVSHAAKLLGIHRRSLQRKLAKFPLPS